LSVNGGALAATFQYHVVTTQETCIYYLDENSCKIMVSFAPRNNHWLDIILDEFYEADLGRTFTRPKY